jgi:predicted nucleic acid-binding protein
MKIVVTDACIFIDVIELQLTSKFFGLNLDIHTTADVLNELYSEQQQILEGYKATNKLTIHVLSGSEQVSLMSEAYPKALTPEDRSVIFIAKKLSDAIVLSSDKPVRNHAKKICIEYHGMLWIFDQLVAQELLTKTEAINRLTTLINSNLIYKNNAEMQEEVTKRINSWSTK